MKFFHIFSFALSKQFYLTATQEQKAEESGLQVVCSHKWCWEICNKQGLLTNQTPGKGRQPRARWTNISPVYSSPSIYQRTKKWSCGGKRKKPHHSYCSWLAEIHGTLSLPHRQEMKPQVPRAVLLPGQRGTAGVTPELWEANKIEASLPPINLLKVLSPKIRMHSLMVF